MSTWRHTFRARLGETDISNAILSALAALWELVMFFSENLQMQMLQDL